MNALAPVVNGVHKVDFLNPASNYRQASSLRLINPGPEATEVVIEATDDAAAPGASKVTLTLQPHTARTLSSTDLESGAEHTEGAFSDGKGKWRLRITATHPIQVMSLLESPTGHLANLSPSIAP